MALDGSRTYMEKWDDMVSQCSGDEHTTKKEMEMTGGLRKKL